MLHWKLPNLAKDEFNWRAGRSPESITGVRISVTPAVALGTPGEVCN